MADHENKTLYCHCGEPPDTIKLSSYQILYAKRKQYKYRTRIFLLGNSKNK